MQAHYDDQDAQIVNIFAGEEVDETDEAIDEIDDDGEDTALQGLISNTSLWFLSLQWLNLNKC